MNIFKTGFTLIVSPHGPGKDIRYQFSPFLVKIFFAIILVVIIGLCYLSAIYGRIYYLALQSNHYKEMNQQLISSMDDLKNLKKELRISERYRKKLCDLLGVEKTPPPVNLNVQVYPEQKDQSTFNAVKRTDIPSIRPVPGFVSQEFSETHPAIDIAAPMGTPIIAPADGYIRDAGWDSIYGNYLTIEHSNYSTFYGHLFQAKVGVGDKVTTGQLIGYVGSTGVSNSPHLHYEVRLNGRCIDPRSYFIK